ncbi:MAG: hypothetical protein, partial [Olavius algarvensis Gamma 1 endosymbiont]
VKFRQTIDFIYEQIGLFLGPVFQGLDGGYRAWMGVMWPSAFWGMCW